VSVGEGDVILEIEKQVILNEGLDEEGIENTIEMIKNEARRELAFLSTSKEEK